MKVLVTGATGLIGREIVYSLSEKGLSVIPLSSKNFNLFDIDCIARMLEKYRAEYLIHLAWITGGDYLSNPQNEDFCKFSYELLKLFYLYGGKKAVFAGTCLEYDFSEANNRLLSENDRLNPTTLYAKMKVKLNELCSNYCIHNGLDYGWGRIFFAYGYNEKAGRLTPSIVDALCRNEIAVVNCGHLIRDYVYAKDIAGAFAAIALSPITGDINICTGKGVSLEEYAMTIAKKWGKQDLLDVHYKQINQPLRIIGKGDKLEKKVGYKIKYDISSAFDEILNRYKEERLV